MTTRGSEIKTMVAFLAIALPIITACGSAGKTTAGTSGGPPAAPAPGESAPASTISHSAPTRRYLAYDGDKDPDDNKRSKGTVNDDTELLATYPRQANPATRRAVEATIKNYYAAAVAGDGARACSLLYRPLVAGLVEGRGSSAHGSKGTCVEAASLFYRQQHKQLTADEVSTMVVTNVRVRGEAGLAILGFHAAPEGEVLVQHEDHVWKIDALLDSEMP